MKFMSCVLSQEVRLAETRFIALHVRIESEMIARVVRKSRPIDSCELRTKRP